MSKTVVGLYSDFETAQNVVRELQAEGFRRDDISLVAHDHAQGRQGRSPHTEQDDLHARASDQAPDAGHHAAAGAGAGAVLGGIAGLVVGLGALAIPGIGPIIAAGPLATTLAGAGIGAVTGGLVGALTDAGVPEDDANSYAQGVRDGGVLVTLRAPDDQAQQAADLMNRYHPIDIRDRSQQWAGAGTQASTPASMSERSTADAPADLNARSHEDSDFRNHYDLVYANRGHDFGFYEPGYRYGYEMAGTERFRGRPWSAIEPEAQRDWARNHPNMAWNDFREAVRHGWERSASREDMSVIGPETGSDFAGPYPTEDEGYGTGMGEGRYADPNNPTR